MSKPTPLTEGQVQYALQELPGWSVEAGKLHREFKFRSFVEAFGFMTKVAIVAQSIDHHPEWFNVYDKVVVDLATHAAGDAITDRDVDLARRINDLT